MTMKLRLIVTLCAAVALAGSALAQDTKIKKSERATGTAYVAGQKVAIDPATGKLRQPTAEEARALAAGIQKLVNHSTKGLTVVQHANGMKSVDLQGRFQSVAVASVGEDGRVGESCVANEAEAKKLAQGKAKRATATPEVK